MSERGSLSVVSMAEVANSKDNENIVTLMEGPERESNISATKSSEAKSC